MYEDRLRRSIVRVQGRVVGTGFFISHDGSILTCFHVVGDKKTGQLGSTPIMVTFDDQTYNADCIYKPPDPDRLDIAVLRLVNQTLPTNALLMPLGILTNGDEWPEFSSFGYKEADKFNGLYAHGSIRGGNPVTDLSHRALFIQLAAEASASVEILNGMSGAPVYINGTDQIIGIIAKRDSEGQIYTPLAIPIEEVAKVWSPVRTRLQEDALARQIEILLQLQPRHPTLLTAIHELFENLWGYDLPAYPDLAQVKAHELVEALRGRGLIYDFVTYLRQKFGRTMISDDALDAIKGLVTNFVNREEEVRKATESYAPQYMLFEGPAGYGKTELLWEIRQRYQRDGWITLYCEPDRIGASAVDMVRTLALTAGRTVLGSIPENLESAGILFAQMLDRRARTFGSPGVVLLLDSVERFNPAEVDPFLNRFLRQWINFNNTKKDNNGTVNLRIIFAGRYVGTPWSNKAKHPFAEIDPRPLSPFRYRYVRETTRKKNPKQSDLDLRAAHLMHLTGGHPGCMARILDDIADYNRSVEAYFTDHDDRYRRMIMPVIRDVRASIPAPLQLIFDQLSVFRRYNDGLLKTLIDAKIIKYSGSATQLGRELAATYLVRRQDGFIQDEIVRRLLDIRMRWDERNEFLKLCTHARDLYFTALQEGQFSPVYMVLEGLFQELRLAYYQSIQDAAARIILREQFFAANGVLQRYLTLLVNKPSMSDNVADLRTLLDDPEEWEFRFTINYFLRDDDYSDRPFDQLLAQIDSIIDNV